MLCFALVTLFSGIGWHLLRGRFDVGDPMLDFKSPWLFISFSLSSGHGSVPCWQYDEPALPHSQVSRAKISVTWQTAAPRDGTTAPTLRPIGSHWIPLDPIGSHWIPLAWRNHWPLHGRTPSIWIHRAVVACKSEGSTTEAKIPAMIHALVWNHAKPC